MKQFTFVREETNRWYVVLNDWEGAKEELEMVAGADQMLDELSHYGDTVTLIIEEHDYTLEGFTCEVSVLERIDHDDIGSGAYYMTDGSLTIDTIWLCDIVLFIYGYFPDRFYYSVTHRPK